MSGRLGEGHRASGSRQRVEGNLLNFDAIVVCDVSDFCVAVVAHYDDIVATHAQLNAQVGQFSNFGPHERGPAAVEFVADEIPP